MDARNRFKPREKAIYYDEPMRFDAELARRGSDSRYPLQYRVILFCRIPLFGQGLTDDSFFLLF